MSDPGADPQTPGQEPGGGQEPTTFTREYVQELRQEAAKYRTQMQGLQAQLDQFADYDALKEAATKWQQHEEEQKGELEKLQEARERAERERDQALQRAQDTLIRSAFVEAASKAGAANPGDAYLLADRSAVSADENGQISGVEEAVKALVDAGRLPMAGRPTAPGLNGGAGDGKRPGTPTLSDEEIAVARKMGLTAEQYQQHKDKIRRE